MRVGVLALLVASPVAAEPSQRLEASGFIGVDYFADDIALGSSIAPEQRPQTAPTVGGRLTYFLIHVDTDVPIAIGPEAELAFTPAWTGYGFDSGRPSYFAPVFGYRLSGIVRFGDGWFQPHLLAGFGGRTVASSSPYMAKETDPVYVGGIGATFPMADHWQLRFDARWGRTDAIDGGMTSTYEVHLAVGTRFGWATQPITKPTEEEQIVHQPPPTPEPDKDRDGDGLPDKLDACPREAEAVNGIEDQDGCPEPDPDMDGLVGSADKCPDKAEDVDKFEDDDGCPDDDNDKDGVADTRDACPNEPETKNGVSDDDGCADTIPASLTAALLAASKLRFDANRARLSNPAKASLDKALVELLANPKIRISVVAHPEAVGPKNDALAGKRADVVKWYLIEQGVASTNVATSVGAVKTKGNVLEITVAQ